MPVRALASKASMSAEFHHDGMSGEDRRGVEPRDAVSDTDTLAKCLLYLWLTIQGGELPSGGTNPKAPPVLTDGLPMCQSFLAVKGTCLTASR